jgi:hypothetical protein
MKKLLFSIMITGAMSLTGIVQSASYTMITVEANNGQILEMPVYIESEIIETIPGSDNSLFLCCQSDLRKEKFEGEMIQLIYQAFCFASANQKQKSRFRLR